MPLAQPHLPTNQPIPRFKFLAVAKKLATCPFRIAGCLTKKCKTDSGGGEIPWICPMHHESHTTSYEMSVSYCTGTARLPRAICFL
eukprot:scaffold4282_cov112-Cylindrotheca_fusiformis.AAC.1